MPAQVYEKPLGEGDTIATYEPLNVVGMIDDVTWEDANNQYLRGFTLTDAKPTLGTGLCILAYHHKPYEAASKEPNLEMEKYKRGKFVKVTFQVFDTYEEATNGPTVLSGCPSCPVISNNGWNNYQ